MNDKTNHRFWEFYLVRYLSGTVFGMLVIIFLSANYTEDINNALSITHGAEKENILTIEIIYKTLFESEEIASCIKKINPQWVCAEEENNGDLYLKVTKEVTIEGLVILFMIGSLFMYVSSTPIYFLHIFRFMFHNLFVHMSQDITAYDFYIYSNKARLKHKESGFVTSYKHLREHGNAFGIILMEMLFAWLLVKNNFSIVLLIIWVSLGFIGWFFGQRLEAIMIEKFRYGHKT